MRRFSFPLALAMVLTSAIALADSDRIVSQFEALAASGISGEARLNPMPQGTTRIQGHLKGLEPNTEYVSVIFQDGTCTTGAGTVLARFTSNPAGVAVYSEVVNEDLSTIRSISVQLASDPTVLACAAVNQ